MSVEKEQFEKVMGELRRACLPAGGADAVQAYVDSLAGDLARVETERRRDLQIQSAMAADQKAVADALGIPPGEYSGGAGEQLLAIEKLREALARVEASAATLAIAGRGAWARASTAESQLAEAVQLIERLAKDGIKGERHQAVFDFLASHAQAEQREAQGAQAGDEARKAAFENHWYAQKATAFGSTEAQRHFDAGWHARAGLASQPAVPEVK